MNRAGGITVTASTVNSRGTNTPAKYATTTNSAAGASRHGIQRPDHTIRAMIMPSTKSSNLVGGKTYTNQRR
jgi:hypothetical protein